jgi:hypothetical protein
MTTRCAVALVPLLVACGLAAGCSSGTGPVAGVSDALHCGRVVDPTGYRGGPLTVDRAVALLTGMQRAGGAARLRRGTPGAAEISTLDTMAVELMGYSGTRVSDDAAAFAQAELNYNPEGPVDASYATPLDGDIRALQRDCPAGMRLGTGR